LVLNKIICTTPYFCRTRCQYIERIDDRVRFRLRYLENQRLLRQVIYRSAQPDGRQMNLSIKPSAQDGKLASDLLRGADQIADFLFGESGQRRKVYHLAETSRLPVFRLGTKLCARRSVLMAWIASQEKRGWQSEPVAISNDGDQPKRAKPSDQD
jgi:hypothetical protein